MTPEPKPAAQGDAFYDVWYRGRIDPVTVPDEDDIVYGWLLRFLAKHITAGTRLLDYGCGDGIIALFAASRGADALGVDFSRGAIARASDYVQRHAIANARFEQVQSDAAGVAGAPFDVVWSSEVIEHVDDDSGLIRSMADVLRPDGICILTTRLARDPSHRLRKWLYGTDPIDLADGHVRRYDAAQLSRVVEGAGFQVLEITTREGFVRTFLYKSRTGGRILRRVRRYRIGRRLVDAADVIAARLFGPAQVIIVARKASARA
jgi:SAM-dependent methyltransferase